MHLKEVFCPHLGRTVKMGRARPLRAAASHMAMGDYLARDPTPPPPSVDWSPAAAPALAQVYANDRLGTCVEAAGYHVLGTWTANAGGPYVADEAQVVADYSAIAGYDPARPSSDQGSSEQVAFDHWTKAGFASGDRLAGWLAVDARDPARLKRALHLFENLVLAAELPDAWLDPTPTAPGFVWDVAGNSDLANGHCVCAVGYDHGGVTVDSWGLLGTITWAALARYFVPWMGGDAYVMVSKAQVGKARDRAPGCLDWDALAADFAEFGGKLSDPDLPTIEPA